VLTVLFCLAEFTSARLANDETTWNSALRHVSQLKHVVISGIGFFSDAYDLFIINIVLAILTAEMEGFGDSDQSAVSTAALAGAIIGQLAFGFIADKVMTLPCFAFLTRCPDWQEEGFRCHPLHCHRWCDPERQQFLDTEHWGLCCDGTGRQR
jgi:hypothetical protein